jgi:hypothetical protein
VSDSVIPWNQEYKSELTIYQAEEVPPRMLPAAFLCSLQANIGSLAYALSNRLTGGISLLLPKIGTSIPPFPDSFLPRSGTQAEKSSVRSHPAALSNPSFAFA